MYGWWKHIAALCQYIQNKCNFNFPYIKMHTNMQICEYDEALIISTVGVRGHVRRNVCVRGHVRRTRVCTTTVGE